MFLSVALSSSPERPALVVFQGSGHVESGQCERIRLPSLESLKQGSPETGREPSHAPMTTSAQRRHRVNSGTLPPSNEDQINFLRDRIQACKRILPGDTGNRSLRRYRNALPELYPTTPVA
jgi:hypothetical protein